MMGRGIALAAFLGVLAAGSAASGEPAPEIKLEGIEVRLIYETSGALSGNVLPPADFSLWNTIIGEGSAAEPASDFLVQVRLSTPADQANSTESLTVTVRDADGKVLGSRKVDGLFLDDHRTVVSLQIPDGTCAGPVTIEAAFGRQKQTASVNFACGE